jgi:hypothetical protein
MPNKKVTQENAMQLAKRAYWIVTAAGVLALGGALPTSPAGAAPLAGNPDIRSAAGVEAAAQKTHWRGRYYRHYYRPYYGYYAPRYYYRPYRHHRPHYYYGGYGPGFYGYAGRPYRYWW